MEDKTLLVVEDNPDHLELALMTLEGHHADAHTVVAQDGIEALEYLFCEGRHQGRDASQQPSLVLLDLNMPKLSGHEVLRRIRSHPLTRFIPVVMLTSSNEASDIETSYREGANGYVCKPVDFGEYTEKLRQLQQYWLFTNEKASPL